MKVVSVINYKGGVGKTTVTSNIAAYVASQGRRVLMIDLDPQTNLTLSFINMHTWQERYAESRTLKNFFLPIIEGDDEARIPLKSLIIPISPSDVKMGLISSNLELIDIDLQLAGGLSGLTPGAMARNFLSVHSYLKDGINEMKNDYDLILIDCPPSFSTIVKNAIAASDYYLVPAKMDYLSTMGIEHLKRNIERQSEKGFIHLYNTYVQQVDKDKYQPIAPSMLGIVPTMLTRYDGGIIQENQMYLNLIKDKKYFIFPWLTQNARLHASAPLDGVPVVLTHHTGATEGRIKEELEELGRTFQAKAGV